MEPKDIKEIVEKSNGDGESSTRELEPNSGTDSPCLLATLPPKPIMASAPSALVFGAAGVHGAGVFSAFRAGPAGFQYHGFLDKPHAKKPHKAFRCRYLANLNALLDMGYTQVLSERVLIKTNFIVEQAVEYLMTQGQDADKSEKPKDCFWDILRGPNDKCGDPLFKYNDLLPDHYRIKHGAYMKGLADMGFSQVQAETALATTKHIGVAAAAEWLLQHSDTDVTMVTTIDPPLPLPRPKNAVLEVKGAGYMEVNGFYEFSMFKNGQISGSLFRKINVDGSVFTFTGDKLTSFPKRGKRAKVVSEMVIHYFPLMPPATKWLYWIHGTGGDYYRATLCDLNDEGIAIPPSQQRGWEVSIHSDDPLPDYFASPPSIEYFTKTI